MELIPRHLAGTIADTLRTSRVINVVGPRQTGKTTLVRDRVEAAAIATIKVPGRLRRLSWQSLLGQWPEDPVLDWLRVDSRKVRVALKSKVSWMSTCEVGRYPSIECVQRHLGNLVHPRKNP
jgi:hypothetical protein